MPFEHPPHGPADWSRRYRDQDTPWDLGAPHPELAARLAAGELVPPHAGARALVPGAGHGHDALALARAGWRVTAIDYAEGARVDEVARELERAGGGFLAQDALAHDGGPYELFLEHTFFCALDPADRPRWGALADRALAPGGTLVAIVFPGDKPREAGGPPWRTELADLVAVLPRDLELVEHGPVAHRVARRDWQESWARFVRPAPERPSPNAN